MDSLPRFTDQTILNSEELSGVKKNTRLSKTMHAETQQTATTNSTTFNAFTNQMNSGQPSSQGHSNELSHSQHRNNSNFTTLMNQPEQSPELGPTKSKPKRRTCYHCGEAGHTTMNCAQTQVNHNLPKRSSGKKLTPEEIQLVIHCYFKCEEERLTHKAAIRADSVRRTAFYLGMSKNTVARLVREYAQTGSLPVSKVRSEGSKTQPAASTSNRKKLKWKGVETLKSSGASETSGSVVDWSLPHSPSLSPPEAAVRSSISVSAIVSLPPVSTLPASLSGVNTSAPTLMGIHEMLVNSNSNLFESDAALANIMNPVTDEDETMLDIHMYTSDTNP